MPELPEVETVRRGLEGPLTGARIAHVDQRRPDLRFPFPEDFAARLAGRRIRGLGRRAKYLLVHLSDGQVLAIHLGMSGRLLLAPARGGAGRAVGRFARRVGGGGATQGDARHVHVVFDLGDRGRLAYWDARRFGYMLLLPGGAMATHPRFAHLGVEPLGPDLTPAYLARSAAGRRVDLKTLLMDQRIIAGLGNIYVSEALHRARLSPLRPAACLARRDGRPAACAGALVRAIRAVLEDAIAAGGATLRDHRRADGTLGYFQHAFAVYGRAGDPCPRARCRGHIQRVRQGGRATFYCVSCQR